MRQEAVLDFFSVNQKRHSTRNMEIFDEIGGESLYEVMKLQDGIPLFFEDHMERMRRSARLSNVELHLSDPEIFREIRSLARENRCERINVKLVWTLIREAEHFLVYFIRSEYPGPDAYTRGVHTILFGAERENPNIKTVKSSFRDQVKKAQERNQAYETLLVDNEGFITEGSRSNIFFVMGSDIYTPPAGTVLMGVTRKHVMTICENLGIRVVERPLHRDELPKIDGAFITGTTVDVLPVASIGDLAVPSASSPCLARIIRAYEVEVKSYISRYSGNC